jgi:hypothetical protein
MASLANSAARPVAAQDLAREREDHINAVERGLLVSILRGKVLRGDAS